MPQQRRLAAILFTDIVGYTALMQQDESKAVAMVKRYISVLRRIVGAHSGEILNDYGDGDCGSPYLLQRDKLFDNIRNEKAFKDILQNALNEKTKLREKIRKMEERGEL